MKKLLFLFLFVPLLFHGQTVYQITPTTGKVVWNFDLSSTSGTDTSFIFKFPGTKNSIVRSWSAQAKWVSSDTTGTIYLQVSNFEKTDWLYYADSLRMSITDGSGTDGIEDEYWNWKYGRFLINMIDTPATGKLYIEMLYQPE